MVKSSTTFTPVGNAKMPNRPFHPVSIYSECEDKGNKLDTTEKESTFPEEFTYVVLVEDLFMGALVASALCFRFKGTKRLYPGCPLLNLKTGFSRLLLHVHSIYRPL